MTTFNVGDAVTTNDPGWEHHAAPGHVLSVQVRTTTVRLDCGAVVTVGHEYLRPRTAAGPMYGVVTYVHPMHGTFTADAEAVTEMMNRWMFGGKGNGIGADLTAIQQAWADTNGKAFGYYDDVPSRFVFAIMFVSENVTF